MKKLLLYLMIALGAAPLWAQTTATTGEADFAAERARLEQERKEVEDRFTA
jgi:colicin import membrane protein